MFWYVIIAILVLLLMIIIHEFGHYIAGKILKFKITEFSVGFGPKIFSKTSKKTGERFSLRAIPLGGFCAFEGEDEIENEKQKNEQALDENPFDESPKSEIAEEITVSERADLKKFNEQAPWKRIIVLISGALLNFVSAIIFSLIFLSVVGVQQPVINEVYADINGVPYNTEIQVGDVITAINGESITPINSYNDIISKVTGNNVVFTVNRNGKEVKVTLVRQQITNDEVDYFGFGIVTSSAYHEIGFLGALKYCVPYTFELAWSVLGAFGQLIVGKVPLNQMTGPVSTIGFMAEATQMDWRNLLILLPLIASNLAVFNLLPIPALDGSKVVFAIIEWIRKKPINRNVEAYIHFAGFAFMILFVILIEILQLIG